MIFRFSAFELLKTEHTLRWLQPLVTPWQCDFERVRCHWIPSFNHPPSCRFNSQDLFNHVFFLSSPFFLAPPPFSLSCGRRCLLRTPVIHLAHIKHLLWASQGARWQRICLQWGKPGFDSWVGKIPRRRAWQPTPVSLPGESHGQRSLVGYSP